MYLNGLGSPGMAVVLLNNAGDMSNGAAANLNDGTTWLGTMSPGGAFSGNVSTLTANQAAMLLGYARTVAGQQAASVQVGVATSLLPVAATVAASVAPVVNSPVQTNTSAPPPVQPVATVTQSQSANPSSNTAPVVLTQELQPVTDALPANDNAASVAVSSAPSKAGMWLLGAAALFLLGN